MSVQIDIMYVEINVYCAYKLTLPTYTVIFIAAVVLNQTFKWVHFDKGYVLNYTQNCFSINLLYLNRHSSYLSRTCVLSVITHSCVTKTRAGSLRVVNSGAGPQPSNATRRSKTRKKMETEKRTVENEN